MDTFWKIAWWIVVIAFGISAGLALVLWDRNVGLEAALARHSSNEAQCYDRLESDVLVADLAVGDAGYMPPWLLANAADGSGWYVDGYQVLRRAPSGSSVARIERVSEDAYAATVPAAYPLHEEPQQVIDSWMHDWKRIQIAGE